MYNFDEIIDRRNTNALNTDGFRGYIFHAGPEKVFPYKDEEFVRMWVADMEFGVAPEILDELRKRIDRRIFGYTGVYDSGYYESFKKWCLDRYDWEFPQEQLCFTPGIIPALYQLVENLCTADEKVILHTPAYGYFLHAAECSKVDVLLSPLKKNEMGGFSVDYENFEKQCADSKAKLVFWCNPQNPTGRMWTREELTSVARIVQKYNLGSIFVRHHLETLANTNFVSSHQIRKCIFDKTEHREKALSIEDGAFFISQRRALVMSTGTEFDYYYGEESNQFSYYRIPRQLVTGERFKRLSTDAKLLYGLLLDRMGLSAKNGWYDEAGRVYIYYTLEEIQKDLSCGHEKAVKLLAELDKGKGIGLIERKKQGQGRPAKIYVKRFTTRAVPPAPPAPDPDPQPRFPIFGNTDFRKPEVQTSENPKSRLPKTGSADFGKTDGSYIKSSQTDFSYIDPSIHPSPSAREQEEGWMDRYDCEEEIKAQIDYDGLCMSYPAEDVNGLVNLIADTLTTVRPTLRIGGENIPTEQVRKRMLSLEHRHLEYVFDSLCRNSTKIRNIRAYLLTALYNAPTTISQYYMAEVRHDFGADASGF